MGYSSISGRAKTSVRGPEAFGVCDRCGRWFNRVELRNQYDWRGAQLAPLYIYVCHDCYDKPQENLKAIVVPADPTPVMQPRTEPFLVDEESTGNFTTYPYGVPVGLIQGAVMPQIEKAKYAVKLPVLSVLANGTTLITVSCSAPHNLATNAQVSVEGLSSVLADGFFSVVVTTATAFTYTTFSPVASGSLLTQTTLMITALVGLPRGQTTIVQVA